MPLRQRGSPRQRRPAQTPADYRPRLAFTTGHRTQRGCARAGMTERQNHTQVSRVRKCPGGHQGGRRPTKRSNTNTRGLPSAARLHDGTSDAKGMCSGRNDRATESHTGEPGTEVPGWAPGRTPTDKTQQYKHPRTPVRGSPQSPSIYVHQRCKKLVLVLLLLLLLAPRPSNSIPSQIST